MFGGSSFKCLSTVLASAFTVGALWSTSARAYHLEDHKAIALESVAELNRCYPNLISDLQSEILWTSNLDEDLNIFRKDIFYSHYFNPYKRLNMLRFDSSVRVSRLEGDLRGDAMDGDFASLLVYAHLGHAIHQIEDAT